MPQANQSFPATFFCAFSFKFRKIPRNNSRQKNSFFKFSDLKSNFPRTLIERFFASRPT